MPYDEEAEQRADLVRVLDDAPAHVLKVVAALLRSVGESPERGDGTDLGAVSRELVAALLWAATGTLLLPDETGQRMRRYEYTRHLSVGFLNAVEWIRHRRSGTLTPQLSQRIIQCRLRGWPMHGVVYVRPTQHYGRSVGLGVFAMVHLRRGQLLFQFAGRVVTGGRCYLAKRAARQDYCIEFNYGLDAYTVNPLDADDVAAHADNVAAFINEPSAPPWQPGDETSVGGRRALVRSYDYRRGAYEVAFDATGRAAWVDAVDLDPWPSSSSSGGAGAQRLFEANVMWYDFPVPLQDLYAPRRGAPAARRSGGGGEVLVYRRTAAQTATVEWPLAAFLRVFSGFSDDTGVYRMERRVATGTLARGHLVYMVDDVFLGLERYGVVVDLGAAAADGARASVTVRHVVSANTLWRLPRTVLAAKAARCAACRRADDPACRRCTVVPFPLVYACSDVRAGQELLCLYSTRVRSRGVPCRAPLQDEDLLPRWDDH